MKKQTTYSIYDSLCFIITIILYFIPIHIESFTMTLLKWFHNSTFLFRSSILIKNFEKIITRSINLHMLIPFDKTYFFLILFTEFIPIWSIKSKSTRSSSRRSTRSRKDFFYQLHSNSISLPVILSRAGQFSGITLWSLISTLLGNNLYRK